MNDFRRTVHVRDLLLLGVGGIVGTGVFVLSGHAAARHAGPAVAVSFLLAGLAAALAGMCYAEAAASHPSAGGAYAYCNRAMGPLVGWIVGWDLLLEYFVGNSVVALGWAAYTTEFIRGTLGVPLDPRWTQAPIAYDGTWVATGAFMNLPAFLGLLTVTALLRRGLRDATRVNMLLVAAKMTALLLFLCVASSAISRENVIPFVPQNRGAYGVFGITGVIKATGLVFFSYVGFDALVTAAQETHDPRRNIPRTLFGCLAICTAIYFATSVVLTGVVSYTALDVANPLSFAARAADNVWLAPVIELGAVAGLSSSMVMGVVAQPRIVYAMAKDGMLPHSLARIDSRSNSPERATTLCGVGCAVIAAFIPIDILNEMVSVGTLFAFGAVSVSIVFVRKRWPSTGAGYYRVPGGPYLIPGLSCLTCVALIASSGGAALARVFGWLCLGLLVRWFTLKTCRSDGTSSPSLCGG